MRAGSAGHVRLGPLGQERHVVEAGSERLGGLGSRARLDLLAGEQLRHAAPSRQLEHSSTVCVHVRLRERRYRQRLLEVDLADRRDLPVAPGDPPVHPVGGAQSPEQPGRRLPLLGAEQEAWLSRNLQRNQARWNCLAQQIMMMSIDRNNWDDSGRVLNMDTWAAYETPRRRLLARMAGLNNVVVLTGDEHQNFAGLLHDRERPVAAEFVATSISSGGDGSDRRRGSERLLAANPQIRFINDQRGYLTCDVTPDEWRTNYKVVDRVSTPGGTLSRRATLAMAHGEVALREV